MARAGRVGDLRKRHDEVQLQPDKATRLGVVD
jgi:hypothetical protein